MTAPVKCPTCEGTTWNIVTEACALYRCGTRNVAVPCTTCGGSGLVMPPPTLDGKTLAAGA